MEEIQMTKSKQLIFEDIERFTRADLKPTHNLKSIVW